MPRRSNTNNPLSTSQQDHQLLPGHRNWHCANGTQRLNRARADNLRPACRGSREGAWPGRLACSSVVLAAGALPLVGPGPLKASTGAAALGRCTGSSGTAACCGAFRRGPASAAARAPATRCSAGTSCSATWCRAPGTGPASAAASAAARPRCEGSFCGPTPPLERSAAAFTQCGACVGLAVQAVHPLPYQPRALKVCGTIEALSRPVSMQTTPCNSAAHTPSFLCS